MENRAEVCEHICNIFKEKLETINIKWYFLVLLIDSGPHLVILDQNIWILMQTDCPLLVGTQLLQLNVAIGCCWCKLYQRSSPTVWRHTEFRSAWREATPPTGPSMVPVLVPLTSSCCVLSKHVWGQRSSTDAGRPGHQLMLKVRLKGCWETSHQSHVWNKTADILGARSASRLHSSVSHIYQPSNDPPKNRVRAASFATSINVELETVEFMETGTE